MKAFPLSIRCKFFIGPFSGLSAVRLYSFHLRKCVYDKRNGLEWVSVYVVREKVATNLSLPLKLQVRLDFYNFISRVKI